MQEKGGSGITRPEPSTSRAQAYRQLRSRTRQSFIQAFPEREEPGPNKDHPVRTFLSPIPRWQRQRRVGILGTKRGWTVSR